jgi:membrane protein
VSVLERLRALRVWLVPRQPEYDPPRNRRWYLIAAFVARRFFVEDRCGGMSAVLTIHTLLSTVPIIGVALLVVGLLGENSGEDLLRRLFITLVPETDRAEDMAQATMTLASNVSIRKLGIWGFLVTLVIAFALFQTLERTFNQIWRVQRKRSVLVKFTMFYTLATLGPLVMLYSLAQPLLPGVGLALGTPFITTAAGCVLLNRFLPYTDVRWRGALVGGLVTAVLFEVGKFGFGLYATRFALNTYEGLYGSLAVLPILIVWSFLSWMVILLGAQIAYAVQHRRAIALLGYMNRYVLDRLAIQQPSGRTAARLMLAVCDQFARRERGLDVGKLAERFGIGLDLVGEILERLEKGGFVIETDGEPSTFVPARPLAQIQVVDVIALFDSDQARNPRDERLGTVFAKVDAAVDEVVGTINYAELVSIPRPETSDRESSQ